jgi:hypothetical protein
VSQQQDEGQVRLDRGAWLSGPCLDRPLNQPHGMSSADAANLWHLRCTFGGKYGISYSGGRWLAHRLGTDAPWNISAATAGELWDRIAEDSRQQTAEREAR